MLFQTLHTHADRHTHTERDRQTHTHTERQTDRQRERERESALLRIKLEYTLHVPFEGLNTLWIKK